MHNYKQWNYDTSSWLTNETKININHLYKTSSDKFIYDFLHWLNLEHKGFIWQNRNFIYSRLIYNEKISISDKLIEDGIYKFDDKIAKQLGFLVALNFNTKAFEYWVEKTQLIKEKHNVLRYFWGEFLSYSFMRQEDFEQGLKNLDYVFDKIDFYAPIEKEFENKYLLSIELNYLMIAFIN